MHDAGDMVRYPANASSRLGLIALLVVVMLVGLTATHAAAEPASNPFEAAFTGIFEITGDVGESGLFVVVEAGSGAEQTGFGAFTYRTSVFQNLARLPAGCGRNSSTGVDGSAVLTFADGQLALHRTSGTVCFAFPTIRVEEEWVVASGTGDLIGVTGRLSREFVGDVRFGTAVGTVRGVIRHN
jgi:hypothetical protein